MNKEELIVLYTKAFDTLTKEIEVYPDDQSLWETAEGISNSAGNLCLHLAGSTSHFIGATLGNTGYARNRDAEFAIRHLPKTELLDTIRKSRNDVMNTLPAMNEAALAQIFPFDFAGIHSTEFYLLFFIGHFHYHVGQINYHRRLLITK